MILIDKNSDLLFYSCCSFFHNLNPFMGYVSRVS